MGECLSIITGGKDLLALIAQDNGGTGILAARQHTASRNVRILQQFERHKAIVIRGFRVVENVRELLQMTGA